MARFRKKPVEIEAIQWTGGNVDEIREFAGEDVGYHHSTTGQLAIETSEGSIWATPGDWVIRGVKGEHYPCKPDIFEWTYDAITA